MKPRADRTPCCVPFCCRTTRRLDAIREYEWICPAHWRLIPLARRRAYMRVHAIWYGADGRGMKVADLWAHPKWGKRAVSRFAAERLWRRLKSMAIKRAVIDG